MHFHSRRMGNRQARVLRFPIRRAEDSRRTKSSFASRLTEGRRFPTRGTTSSANALVRVSGSAPPPPSRSSLSSLWCTDS